MLKLGTSLRGESLRQVQHDVLHRIISFQTGSYPVFCDNMDKKAGWRDMEKSVQQWEKLRSFG